MKHALLILVLCGSVYAQRPAAGRLYGGAGLPTENCNAGPTRPDIYVRTDVNPHTVHICSAEPNTWTPVGGIAVVDETSLTFTDITTANATTLLHGLLPKLGGGSTNFLRADGTWSAPPSPTPGGSTTQIQLNLAGVFAGDSDLTFATDTLSATKASLGAGAFNAPSLMFGSDTTSGWYRSGADQWTFSAAGSPKYGLYSVFIRIASASGIAWAQTDNSTDTADTGINRNAAGVVEVNNGSAGTLRDLKARAVLLGSAGGSSGDVALLGSTSGTAHITVGAAAGTPTLTLPTVTGTLSVTIASGTSVLGTSAISSAACASVVTTTATGTATTDAIVWGFNGDPTGVTGYTPVTTGALTIFAYPSANNVNYRVCNLTGSSITPGAITLNWRVVR